jgi:hypothetical protein
MSTDTLESALAHAERVVIDVRNTADITARGGAVEGHINM